MTLLVFILVVGALAYVLKPVVVGQYRQWQGAKAIREYRAAAEEMLSQKPGRWCLSVYKKNQPARAFWNRLIEARGNLVCQMPGEEGMTDLVFDTK